jgi:hypothetical protein
MKKSVFLMIIVIIVLSMSSCSKEEETIVPNYVFKQTAYLEQNGWGDSDSLYPVFKYRVAIMANKHFDDIKVTMTVTLVDNSEVILTEEDLTNFGQLGYSAPDYEYPIYWIAHVSDSKGICESMYGFTAEEVVRIDYAAQVQIDGHWITLPSEERNISDPMDSFWI